MESLETLDLEAGYCVVTLPGAGSLYPGPHLGHQGQLVREYLGQEEGDHPLAGRLAAGRQPRQNVRVALAAECPEYQPPTLGTRRCSDRLLPVGLHQVVVVIFLAEHLAVRVVP